MPPCIPPTSWSVDSSGVGASFVPRLVLLGSMNWGCDIFRGSRFLGEYYKSDISRCSDIFEECGHTRLVEFPKFAELIPEVSLLASTSQVPHPHLRPWNVTHGVSVLC